MKTNRLKDNFLLSFVLAITSVLCVVIMKSLKIGDPYQQILGIIDFVCCIAIVVDFLYKFIVNAYQKTLGSDFIFYSFIILVWSYNTYNSLKYVT